MASTYVIQDAIDIVSSTVTPRGAENVHTAADLALRYLWREYTWRESLSPLPPFYLIPNRQDYGAPWSVIPEDFDSLQKAWLVYTPADSSGAWRKDIDVKAEVEFTNYRGNLWPPEAITYQRALGVLRLSSPTPANVGCPQYFIEGEYKVKPAKIVAATAGSTTFPLDDDIFPAYIETVRWKVFQLNGDPRAGSIQVFGTGQRQYSGQAAIAHDLIVQSIEEEEEGRGPAEISPESSLTEW